jgi:hypothetical protein
VGAPGIFLFYGLLVDIDRPEPVLDLLGVENPHGRCIHQVGVDLGRHILVLVNDTRMKFDLEILFGFIITYGAKVA